MKKMTCAQMGGMCDAEITGSTSDEMMANGMKHLEAFHPEMAESVKSMPDDHPMMVAWKEKFLLSYQQAPEIK